MQRGSPEGALTCAPQPSAGGRGCCWPASTTPSKPVPWFCWPACGSLEPRLSQTAMPLLFPKTRIWRPLFVCLFLRSVPCFLFRFYNCFIELEFTNHKFTPSVQFCDVFGYSRGFAALSKFSVPRSPNPERCRPPPLVSCPPPPPPKSHIHQQPSSLPPPTSGTTNFPTSSPSPGICLFSKARPPAGDLVSDRGLHVRLPHY